MKIKRKDYHKLHETCNYLLDYVAQANYSEREFWAKNNLHRAFAHVLDGKPMATFTLTPKPT